MNPTPRDPHPSRQAREALTSAHARSRSAAGRLPDRAAWFDALWTGYIGGLVLSISLPAPFNLMAVLVLVFGLRHAVSVFQDRYGVWVSGFRSGMTRAIAVVQVAMLLTIMAIVWFYRQHYGLAWPAIPGAAVAMVAGYAMNRLWMHAYRRETGQM